MMRYINFRRFSSIFQGSCSHIVVYIPWHASALGIKSKVHANKHNKVYLMPRRRSYVFSKLLGDICIVGALRSYSKCLSLQLMQRYHIKHRDQGHANRDDVLDWMA